MKPNSLQHAEHNFEVCQKLFKETDYHDWVITIAFYAALHFARHKLFPMTIRKDGKRVTYQSFQEFTQRNRRYRKKHMAMRMLIEEHFPARFASIYNQMLDNSFTARYVEYNYPKHIAAMSVKRLEMFRDYCIRK